MAFMGSEGRGSATGYAIIGGGWFEKHEGPDWLGFFFKTMLFWFFKKNSADPVKTWWPGQNPEPESWTGLATRPDLKTMTVRT